MNVKYASKFIIDILTITRMETSRRIFDFYFFNLENNKL